MLHSQIANADSPRPLPGGAILREVFVDVLIRNRKVVLERDIGGFAKQLFLQLLVAERRPVLVGNVPLLKRAVRDGQRELPVLGSHADNPVQVIPAAGLQLESSVLNEHAHSPGPSSLPTVRSRRF
ncbi:hypothetical protein SBA2_270081 [Acidobacteriia bacterium SbA2]|nr:hypothetical protein SBA2_270081 [Acidobacteriia bacterium SbA2]